MALGFFSPKIWKNDSFHRKQTKSEMTRLVVCPLCDTVNLFWLEVVAFCRLIFSWVALGLSCFISTSKVEVIIFHYPLLVLNLLLLVLISLLILVFLCPSHQDVGESAAQDKQYPQFVIPAVIGFIGALPDPRNVHDKIRHCPQWSTFMSDSL